MDRSKIIFQPKGYSTLDSAALRTYSHIMIVYGTTAHGILRHTNDTTCLDNTTKDVLNRLCDAQLGKYQYIVNPTSNWFQIDGDKVYALRTIFVRTGANGNVMERIYWLQNRHQQVLLLTAYRITEADQWRDSIDSTIASFRWNNAYQDKSIVVDGKTIIAVLCSLTIVLILIILYARNRTK